MDKLDLLAGGGGENQVNLLIFQWQALIYLARFKFLLSFWKIPNLILIELNWIQRTISADIFSGLQTAHNLLQIHMFLPTTTLNWKERLYNGKLILFPPRKI